jgi:raffinose/stachyose/melibiose transport system permease protein
VTSRAASAIEGGTPQPALKSNRPAPGLHKRRQPKHKISYILVAAVLFFYVFPLAFLINTALKSNTDFIRNPGGITTHPHFGNFPTAWSQGHFGSYILNSVFYSFSAALIGTAISLILGFPVSRDYIAGARWWRLLFVFVLFLPNALITQFQLLLHLHLYDAKLGYILIMSAGIGIGPLLMHGYAKSIPREIDEAAAIDGIGYWAFLLKFVIPFAKPALATIFVLQAIWTWNDIIVATVMLPAHSNSPLTLGLFNFQGTYSNEWGLLAAATMIVAAPLIAAYIFLQRYLIGGVLGGAVKG